MTTDKIQDEPEPKTNLKVQYRFLAKLDARIDGLSGQDSADTFNKLSSALSTAHKSCVELEKYLNASPGKARAKTQMTARDRADKIAELCKLVSQLSPEDYDPAKLERRAGLIAEDFNARFGDGNEGHMS